MTFPAGQGIAERLAAARDRAAQSLTEGRGGIAIAEQLSDDIDAIVTELCEARFAEAGLGLGSGISVLATGGFGRREYAPFSDLDLIFLFAAEPEERGAKLAEGILHPLWDARMDA